MLSIFGMFFFRTKIYIFQKTPKAALENFSEKIEFFKKKSILFRTFCIDCPMKIFDFEIFLSFRISNLQVEVTPEHRGGVGVGPQKFQGSQPTGSPGMS